MRASIRDVAEHAGVSAVTVSNVLRGRTGRTSAATRARVLKAAKTLRYAPVAGPTTQKRHVETRVLGLVFDGALQESVWGMEAYWGMREAAIKHDYDLLTMLRVRPDWMLDQEELQFLDRRSDGFIFIAPVNRYQMLEELVKHKLPVVACFTRDVPSNVPAVTLDNANAMRQQVQYLKDKGHQRILYLTTIVDRTDFAERQLGYEEAMEQAGFSPQVLKLESIYSLEFKMHLVAAIKRYHITAVACVNDSLADIAWQALTEEGMEVPQDISLIGMDDLVELAERGLTSISYSSKEVGRQAAEAAVSLLEGGDAASASSVVPVQLVERSSVATI